MSFSQTPKLFKVKAFLLAALLSFIFLIVSAPIVIAAPGDSRGECTAAGFTWEEYEERGQTFGSCVRPAQDPGTGTNAEEPSTTSPTSPAEDACTGIGGSYDQGAGAHYVCNGYDKSKLTSDICLALGTSAGSACDGSTVTSTEVKCGNKGSFFGLPKWHKYLKKNSNCEIEKFCVLDSSEDKCTRSSIPLVVLALIEIALRIGSLIAVAFVVVGGFKFVTSQGEPDGVKSARNTILNALIGLVITIVATPIVSFIGNRFGA